MDLYQTKYEIDQYDPAKRISKHVSLMLRSKENWRHSVLSRADPSEQKLCRTISNDGHFYESRFQFRLVHFIYTDFEQTHCSISGCFPRIEFCAALYIVNSKIFGCHPWLDVTSLSRRMHWTTYKSCSPAMRDRKITTGNSSAWPSTGIGFVA